MKIIVGIDPGVTTAVAIFDLNGNLIEVFSKKGMNKGEIVKRILKVGVPLVISADKKKLPKLIDEISSALCTMSYTPKHDLSVKKKMELSKKFKPRNAHERDALASALYFLKKNKRKFSEIDRVLESMDLQKYSEHVKELILLGKAKSLSDALEKVLGDTKIITKKKPKITEKKISKDEKLKSLERSYEIAKEYIEKLERRVRELEEQKEFLLKEKLEESKKIRKELMRDKEIELRDNIINNLRKELEKERKAREELERKIEILEEERLVEAQGFLPVIKIHEFSKESIFSVKNIYRIFNRVLYFESPCRGKIVAKYLVSLRPRLVIGDFGKEESEILEQAGVPVIPKNLVKNNLAPFKRFFGIEKDVIENILKKERKNKFVKWLEAYKKRFL